MKIKKLSNERFEKTMEQHISHMEYNCPTCYQPVSLEVGLPIYGRAHVKVWCKKCNVMISADVKPTMIENESGQLGTPFLPYNVGEAVATVVKAWNSYREGARANAKRKTELP